MAGKLPFRVTSPAPKGGTTDGEKAAPWPGKGIVRAQREGGPLPNPADITAADLHGHSPVMPREPVDNGPKPFKLKDGK